MYQYRANVEFDIDGLKDFYIDDLMEQELNIYLMVECWIRDYIDIKEFLISSPLTTCLNLAYK